MGIKPSSHNETGLFASAPFFLELLKKTLLELMGNSDERPGDVVVLVNHFFVYRSNTIYPDVYTLMNISIRNILCDVVELTCSLILKLLASSLFRHLIQ